MDIFKFTNPDSPTKMEQGVIINHLASKLWIERYLEAGEFTFTAPMRSGIMDILPIGTYVSHTNTQEIMVVEDHHLVGKKGDDISVEITGSSLEAPLLDSRIVGANRPLPFVGQLTDYGMFPQHIWDQVVFLISRHIYPIYVINQADAIPYILVASAVPTDTVGESKIRELKRGSLYETILELLKFEKLGIKTVRPADTPNTTMYVHKGVDRSKEVIFSYSLGEIDNIEYLISNRKDKNTALVSGKWVEILVTTGSHTGMDRRVMAVAATEFDDAHDSPPQGLALALVEIALDKKGREELKKQNEIALKKAEIDPNFVPYKYRKDYDLGDLVGISAGYVLNETDPTIMRVVEYVEVEDDRGRVGYPTLALDPPDEEES